MPIGVLSSYVPPFFDDVKVFENIIIASYKGQKGAVSREYVTKEPYCDNPLAELI